MKGACMTSRVLSTTTAGIVAGEALNAGVVFRGIPFAAVPVGPRRFRPPEPVASWEGVRDATTFGPACPQSTNGLPIVARMATPPVPLDEDCLSLNVWTPAVDTARRP